MPKTNDWDDRFMDEFFDAVEYTDSGVVYKIKEDYNPGMMRDFIYEEIERAEERGRREYSKKRQKLGMKCKNQKNEIKRLKEKVRRADAQTNLLFNAFEKLGVTPRLCCSCWKDDCACFDHSVSKAEVLKAIT